MAKDHSPAGKLAEVLASSDELGPRDQVTVALDVFEIDLGEEETDALAAQFGKAAGKKDAQARAELLYGMLVPE